MKKILLTVGLLLFLSGCNKYQSYDSIDSKPVRIGDLYFKQILINNVYVILQCDSNGKIITQNTSSHYTSGKTQVSSSVIFPTEDNSIKNKFVFECTVLSDCEIQIQDMKSNIK